MSRREEGFAMVTAIGVLFIALMLSGAAILSATSASDTSNRDRATKRALQAADAGIKSAVFRMNRLKLTDSGGQLQCLANVTGGLSVINVSATLGWCPAVTENIGNGQSYSYRQSAAVSASGGQTTLDRTIVATGTSNGVTRRVAVKAKALAGTPLFGDASIISLKDLWFEGSNTINGNVRSNGNISLGGNAHICGTATAGPGKTAYKPTWLTPCAGYSGTSATTPLVLPPVDQGNAATVNDNGRICGLDPCTNTHGATPYVNTTQNPRYLNVQSDTTVVLGGNVYSFCKVDLGNNGTIQIAPRDPGTSVRIYIDSPESCGQTAAAFNPGQFNKLNGGHIVNQNSTATTLQIYAVGSATIPTHLTLSDYNVVSVPLVIYAPRSTVTLGGLTNITGAVAADQIDARYNNITVTGTPSTASLSTSALVPIYRAGEYKECTSANGAPNPLAGC